MGLGDRRLALLGRLKRHEVKADHATRKMDLPDAVREDFFFIHGCKMLMNGDF